MSKDVKYVEICDLKRHRISLEDQPYEVVFERLPIKRQTVFDLINSGLSFLPNGKRPTRIFVGPDEMFELTRDYRYTRINQETSVLFEDVYRQHDTQFGVQLVIIPHMRGVLII